MKKHVSMIALALLTAGVAIIASTVLVSASTVTFNFIESPSDTHTLTASFTIDDSLFNGASFQGLPNSDISSLSATANSVQGSFSFGTADIDLTGFTFFNSSISPVIVADGGGFLAKTSSAMILIGPGTQTELLDPSDTSLFATYDGVWTETTTATPIPAALPLFATGLGGLGLLGWRRKRKAQA